MEAEEEEQDDTEEDEADAATTTEEEADEAVAEVEEGVAARGERRGDARGERGEDSGFLEGEDDTGLEGEAGLLVSPALCGFFGLPCFGCCFGDPAGVLVLLGDSGLLGDLGGDTPKRASPCFGGCCCCCCCCSPSLFSVLPSAPEAFSFSFSSAICFSSSSLLSTSISFSSFSSFSFSSSSGDFLYSMETTGVLYTMFRPIASRLTSTSAPCGRDSSPSLLLSPSRSNVRSQ